MKNKILFQLTNFGEPFIAVQDANHENRGELLLRHDHQGVDLRMDYAREVLSSMQRVWKRPVEIHTAFGLPFAIFLLRNYFAGIPRDLLEAARMDGGTEWTIFLRVIFPLGGPAIASLGIFQFLWVWNDLLIALIFAGRDSLPLTVAIQQQVRQFGANIDVIAPGSFVSLVVPLIVFFAFQRYFVQGVMAGSVK